MDISSSTTTTAGIIIHHGGHAQFDYTTRLKSTSHGATPLYPSPRMQIQIINPLNLGSPYNVLLLMGASPSCRVGGAIWLLSSISACYQLRQ